MTDELFHLRSGFCQNRIRRCGVEAVAEEIYLRIGGPRVRVQLHNWDYSIKESAANIAGLAPRRVTLIGYSWGGDAVVDLAHSLKRAGVIVDDMILADAVYRSGLFPSWIPANVYSLMPFGKIKIPPNVRRVHRFYQRQNKPQGHNLKVTDETRVAHDEELQLRHDEMDDAPQFKNKCLQVAGLL